MCQFVYLRQVSPDQKEAHLVHIYSTVFVFFCTVEYDVIFSGILASVFVEENRQIL